MNNTQEEAQAYAIQQTAGHYGIAALPGYAHSLSDTAKFVIKQAEVRGVVIRAYGDINQQALAVLGECLIEAATAFATGALSLQKIAEQVRGTEVEMAVVNFNAALSQDFAQQIRTIYALTGQGITSQFRPFDVTEQKRNWVQRFLTAG